MKDKSKTTNTLRNETQVEIRPAWLLLVLTLIVLRWPATAQRPTQLTILGTESSAGGVWDTGTATLTVSTPMTNAYSISIPYGRYSTGPGMAAAFGALLSQSATSPVNAQADGNLLQVLARSSAGGVINSLSIVIEGSQASFHATPAVASTPTGILVTASPAPATVKDNVQVLITVSPSAATGTIALYDGGVQVSSGSLSNGSALMSLTGLAVGVHALTAAFSGDATYLPSSSQPFSLAVDKVDPAVSWSVPASISLGSPLGAAQLDASSNVSGTFTYQPGPGAILAAGTQTLSVTFTPNDASTYNVVTSSVPLVVNGIQMSGPPGTIHTLAGNGSSGFSGDGGLATSAGLNGPVEGLGVDSSNNVYFCEGYNRVREVSATTGLITTIGGNGTFGFSGDGGPAVNAQLRCDAFAVDGAGDVFIGDVLTQRIRKISASTGIISTVAGNGTPGYNGDGGPGTSASIELQKSQSATDESLIPVELAANTAGDLYFYNAGEGGVDSAYDVRVVLASTGVISTFGNGKLGTSSRGNSSLFTPDQSGNLFFVNDRLVAEFGPATNNTVVILAGDGQRGSSGDGGPASQAEVSPIGRVLIDSAGNLFFKEPKGLRKIEMSSGLISTLPPFGGGQGCSQQSDVRGDDCLAIDAPGPLSLLAFDSSDNIVTTDSSDVRGIIRFRSTQQASSETALSCSANTYGSPILCNVGVIVGNAAGTGSVELSYLGPSTGTETYTPGLLLSSGLASASSATTLPVGAYSIAATYAGNDTELPSVATTSVTIAPAIPQVTWAAPNQIAYGIPLGSSQLNASTSIPGVFTYVPGPTTVLPVGTHSLKVTFVPNDALNYTGSVVVTQTITVIPTEPTISWRTPAPIEYGTALGTVQLNASSNVPGSYAYSYDGNVISSTSNTVLPTGLHELDVTFTPSASSNTANTNPLTASVKLEVLADQPIVSGVLPNPAVVGQQVTIEGSNFGPSAGTSTITFNGVSASATQWTDTSIVVSVPVGAATGPLLLTVGGAQSKPFLLMIPKSCP